MNQQPTHPLPPSNQRAYVVRGLDLDWHARSVQDGRTIAQDAERSVVAHEAQRRGFILVK